MQASRSLAALLLEVLVGDADDVGKSTEASSSSWSQDLQGLRNLVRGARHVLPPLHVGVDAGNAGQPAESLGLPPRDQVWVPSAAPRCAGCRRRTSPWTSCGPDVRGLLDVIIRGDDAVFHLERCHRTPALQSSLIVPTLGADRTCSRCTPGPGPCQTGPLTAPATSSKGRPWRASTPVSDPAPSS